jgi:hypothetical protein
VPATRESDPEDFFYGRPVTFSWNGESFEQLDPDWVGITSYSAASPVYRVQGIPRVSIVADLDHDGMNEVVVGTMPYRDANQRGALYVFQWDGTRFVAEFSDYCMGGVQRLDLVNLEGEDLVVVSAVMRPVLKFDGQVDASICPQLRKTPGEADTGLYLLRAISSNEYETWPLTLDDNRLTPLTIAPTSSSDVLFARTSPLTASVPVMIDWSTVQLVEPDGQVREEALGIENTPFLQMEMADLDGDGNNEIVALTAKGYSGIGSVNRDDLVWQVYQSTQGKYVLVYEGLPHYSHLYYFFAAGDIDGDGAAEIIESSGEVYEWVDDRLSSRANLVEDTGKDLYYGLESIYIGDLFGDGQSRIVFTGRYAEGGRFAPTNVLPGCMSYVWIVQPISSWDGLAVAKEAS